MMQLWSFLQSAIVRLFLVIPFFLFSLSQNAFGIEPDRQLCVNALSEVNQYVRAKRELAAARFGNNALTTDAYEQLIIEYDDIEASVSMAQCMAGDNTVLYQCLSDQKGQYPVCR